MNTYLGNRIVCVIQLYRVFQMIQKIILFFNIFIEMKIHHLRILRNLPHAYRMGFGLLLCTHCTSPYHHIDKQDREIGGAIRSSRAIASALHTHHVRVQLCTPRPLLSF